MLVNSHRKQPVNPLYRDKAFLFLCIPAMVVLICSLVGITIDSWDMYSFRLFGATEDWSNFITLYKVPLSIAAGVFALFALFTSMHRVTLQSAQVDLQSQQLADAKKLNEFNIYFKQREEFDKKFSESMSEWIKKIWQDNQLRLNEFFEDFDPTDVYRNEHDKELICRSAKVICLRIYEFCFGVGRRIHLSDEFITFISSVHSQLKEIEGASVDVALEQKAKLNEYVRQKFIEDGKITYWRGMYESEWFSDNEKYHLTLAIVRLLAEVEAFSGCPRDIDGLQKLCDQGQSIEHAFFYGPNMILGERNLSPGGRAGRRPNLLSKLFHARGAQEKDQN